MTTMAFFNSGKIACFLAMMLLSLPLVAGFFGTWHPAFDSFAHFRVHLAVLMMLAAVPLLFSSLRWQAIAALAFGAAALSTTSSALPLPGLGPVHAAFQPRTDDRPAYKMLQMNLRFDNAYPEKVLSLVGRMQPDVIAFEEVSDMWAGKLQPLFMRYPYRMLCRYPNRMFGVALLSRRPFAEGTQPQCFGNGALAIAKVDFGGRTADVAALHLGWPWPFEQSRLVTRLSSPLGSMGENALLGGDFNATPWSATVSRVAEAGGLTLMPAAGRTWLTFSLPEFMRFAGLTIDHVLAKGDVVVHSVTMGEDAGSDHRPLLVEFSFSDAHVPAEEAETETVSSQAGTTPRG
ncbi:endonuclease/exonuclease/phosphatase family protein [Aminobacter sp. AP02]|uniref:endonuclease/exonuclease/phosphatase family protein n=1 Tax=Aminobacter sp. AP02 TaxID=2135737 RepID=UPI000D79925F|nr:endonuclease/exonuclease/phosphatase family protein [Aminobacter sp. AP02]PWK75710.1 endonuclease/exonuclease/phosphatase (EEP) superfamily protein YafD [Aminobacter sp. AP02]